MLWWVNIGAWTTGFNAEQPLNSVLFIMQIETKNKGKEAVSAMEKGKEVVPLLDEVPLTDEDVVVEEPHSGKCRNYGHYHEGGPTHFCKVILCP